jgi:hypothetical protein
LAATLLWLTPSWAVGLLDGGFEQPVIVNFAYNPGGSPWTFSANTGLQRPPSSFSPTAAPQGAQTAFLQNAVPQVGTSMICQDVPGFAVGTSYRVDFQFAGRAANSVLCPMCDGGNPFELRADGALVDTFPAPSPLETYVPGSTKFRAQDTTITLCFVGLGAPGTDDVTSFIDAVQITALLGAPALGGWVMVGAVLSLLLIGLAKLRYGR